MKLKFQFTCLILQENSNDLPKKKKRKIRVPKDPDEELVQVLVLLICYYSVYNLY